MSPCMAWAGRGVSSKRLRLAGPHGSSCPLQTTARTRKRYWEPVTAARVSATRRVPALPSADPSPQLLHPPLSKGSVKPGNARPFSLHLNPTAPARLGWGCEDISAQLVSTGREMSPKRCEKWLRRSTGGKCPRHRGEGGQTAEGGQQLEAAVGRAPPTEHVTGRLLRQLTSPFLPQS